MVIKTKMDALQVYREGVLPRIIAKYEQDPPIMNPDKRRYGWNSFIAYLCDQKKLIPETLLEKWQTVSSRTSDRFLADLYKSKIGDSWEGGLSVQRFKDLSEASYKGNPLLCLNILSKSKSAKHGVRFPFKFGLEKALTILENLDEIRYFVEKYNVEIEPPEKDEDRSNNLAA